MSKNVPQPFLLAAWQMVNAFWRTPISLQGMHKQLQGPLDEVNAVLKKLHLRKEYIMEIEGDTLKIFLESHSKRHVQADFAATVNRDANVINIDVRHPRGERNRPRDYKCPLTGLSQAEAVQQIKNHVLDPLSRDELVLFARHIGYDVEALLKHWEHPLPEHK